MTELGRRHLLSAAGLGTLAGATAGATGAYALTRPDDSLPKPRSRVDTVPFHGVHQAGIATPVQDRLHFAAFDVTTESRDQLIDLLRNWTRAAALMTIGRSAGNPLPSNPAAAPDDSGEALGLSPARLTLTIGFGPTLFEKYGRDRYGINQQRPEALTDLPRFDGDHPDPLRSGGDIAIQACADDPQVAVHAIRQLTRIAFGTAMLRWGQLGFGKTSSTTPGEATPRNLMGFKDGTDNIAGHDDATLNKHIWVAGNDSPSWMTSGSYLVARRIRMHLEAWDQAAIADQEDTFGRTKGEGAPHGHRRERDLFNPATLPQDSHVRLAHPKANSGIRILRRSYSFTDGSDRLGRLDAGLFFLAYQRDPRTGFIPIQRKLAENDRLNAYIRHVASGIWAIPPGTTEEGYWGDTLFGS